MEIAIIGLPQSGKTSVFAALTGRQPEASHGARGEPSIGIVKVPDARLEQLAAIFKPQKIVPAEIAYIDYGFAKGIGKTEGLTPQFLTQLARADAILDVVRVFEDPSVPHVEGSVDLRRDITSMDLELAFADMSFIERRLDRMETALKAAKPQEREAARTEQDLLARIKASLENNVPLNEQDLAPQERKLIENYQFITARPLLHLLNYGEGQEVQVQALEEDLNSTYASPNRRVASLNAKVEMELAQLAPEEAEEFGAAMGVSEPARDKVLRLSYEMLGIISFLTVGADEVRAWPVRRGAEAVKAAGKIHSDIERGFIRAEVVPWQELVAAGSLAESRKRGVLRLEGKTYHVQDGDVITFLFNV